MTSCRAWSPRLPALCGGEKPRIRVKGTEMQSQGHPGADTLQAHSPGASTGTGSCSPQNGSSGQGGGSPGAKRASFGPSSVRGTR
ncbi:hypothetical protein AV530_011371 [Patagioenas fasciata monilis]|uniref:Uncharacterized protein n=1 Tax=Patagioenas fasciata monilis TaxID=372326 RepID=A0A1V4KP63_PATFA|nr:hypothetical protein AV530_011371 [Patagioenas fasciata monilis]